MTYELMIKIWGVCVLTAVTTWTVLFFRLLFGILRGSDRIIKSSIKYIINTLSFLFVYVVYFSFFIVVQAPFGKTKNISIKMLNDWVNQESFEWSLWALLLVILLVMFNIVYQLRIEKINDKKQIIILTVSNVLIMSIGIFLGSTHSIIALMEEINRRTY